MPGIVVFRRRWSVGSDDLVVPGAFLFVLHLIWVIVLGVLLGVLEWDRSMQCVLLLWEYVIGYLVIFVTSMAVEFAMCLLATRGSILDTAARAPMQHLLYIRLFLLIVEAAWLSAGVTWLTRFYQSCPVDRAKDVMLGLVICNWCVLASVLVTVWCVYDTAGRSWVKMKKYQRSMREAETRGDRMHYKRSGSNRNWRQRKVLRAYQDSWDNRCRILFCCIGKSDRNRNSFADIARLLSDFFRDLDVVPSDVVAGLVLLRKFQKIERELIVKQRKNDTYEFLSGVPVTSHTKFLSLTEDGDLHHLQSAIHYMHFALAAYGWPLFLVNHSTGCCQLCTRLRCCCFPCARRNDDAIIVADNCCQCNYAALRRMIEIGDIEVVYATFHVDVGETPFFVALDYTKKKVVVSIRGTLSMKDVMTDLNAEAEVLPLSPPREDWFGHKGMVQAAEYIRKKLSEEAIIKKALIKDPSRGTNEFGLTLVGHSLGAGTAAILAILLKQEYPDLVCFAYAPPGGLLSVPAQEYSQEFITSVVVGKDVVPRIGLRQMESLREDLINAIKRSVDPKWKTITCSVMCCGCGTVPTSAANLEAGGCISQYQREKDLARSQGHKPLYPPGRIIHVVRHHPNKGEQKYESRWRQMLRKREPVYQALWAGPCDFNEVLISPVMIQDHMPDNMLKALNKVSEHREISAQLSSIAAAAAVAATSSETTRSPMTTATATLDVSTLQVTVATMDATADVVTTLGPAKPQRLASGRLSADQQSRNSSNSATPTYPLNCQDFPDIEVEQEMRALLASSSPTKPPHRLTLPSHRVGQAASDGPTPKRRLCLETSFTSLQSPLTDNYPQIGRELSVDSRGLPWEYVSIASEILASPIKPADLIKASLRASDWSNIGRLAPLATPETMSEASGSSPPSPIPACHRPMMRRTPKIPGGLSTAADDLKNNLHFAMLTGKNYYRKNDSSSSSSNSNANSEVSYGSAKSLAQGPPPPPPKRRDSVLASSREHRVCTAACCRDDLSDNSSPHATSFHSSKISHRVQIDFTAEDEHSLDFFKNKTLTEAKESGNDVLLSVRSSPECRGLMAPATDAGAEWRRNKQLEICAADASLPLLRGLSPTPHHHLPTTVPGSSNSPFFNAKRKKYIYPITLVSRGESSV
ncbi:diacylglycerol lipase-alpha isoform X1 [Phymastichus coffea]|uniref:diacylglycerol lipase-alpha isoform X1 n=1 Tax=Phymastichus coffea TaxID=108790 RepID=UPI00273B982A|nr:diacylglycerol lipase-alpha isoform X1 [Phymastichus coffea]XP_058798544.1 diacylglycerol lipase-alpha isoform X1 [Phymastichus coffea]XP_058798545.1 diacylglycerol lipase-alpha isoform X1 [Phymastichus coffea]XP_058798546.1 diacylglycerol lipase-alpha isoform X1 [Phymastichus coffea]